MRAAAPDVEGRVVRDGVALGYQVFDADPGGARPTVLLLPTWTIVHARVWKLQIPYLARHFRVVVYDGPGNGMSDRSTDPCRYSAESYALDAATVLDHCGIERAVAVGVSLGAPYGLQLAHLRPDLVEGLVLVAGALPFGAHPERVAVADRILGPAPTAPIGWERYNVAYWHADYDDFATFFFEQVFSEPHSTKAREDARAWAGETSPQVLAAGQSPPGPTPDWEGVLETVSCPMLFVHGTDDRLKPPESSVRAAAIARAPVVTLEGAGHLPNVRDPVRFNLLLREFVEQVAS